MSEMQTSETKSQKRDPLVPYRFVHHVAIGKSQKEDFFGQYSDASKLRTVSLQRPIENIEEKPTEKDCSNCHVCSYTQEEYAIIMFQFE